MIIIGKAGCENCKKAQETFPGFKYIEIPDDHIGLGDSIFAITHFLRIEPCKGCMIRRYWCNKVFPYFWNIKKIDPSIIELKQKIIRNTKVKRYPIISDDKFTNMKELVFE